MTCTGFRTFVACGCGSTNLQVLRREPVHRARYTDYRITYKCLDCGKETTRGA